MHHVKSEHEKDEDDDLDDDRKPELGHHGHHSYYQHPMGGGHYNNSHHHHHSLKTEIDTISKNQTGSDCGVPIPASKPKIWSLADTAACKTPPPHLHPNAGAWGYQTTTAHQHPSQQQYSNSTESPTLNHQHQMHRQHQSQYHHHLQDPQQQQQQQQMQAAVHMGMNMQAANGAADTTMNMNMITSGHPSQSMSGMMNTFGGSSPYSRYGGFLTAATHPIQQQAQAMPQAQYINHSHTGGSTTPLTPNSTGQPTTPTLQQQTSSNPASNQTMGFPEVQTGKITIKKNSCDYHLKLFISSSDTPPQTPPNMKFNTASTTTTGLFPLNQQRHVHF